MAGGVGLGCSQIKDAAFPQPTIHQAPSQRQLNQPIQHVYVIFKENHTYDNYFAGYPNPTGDAPITSGLAANGRVVPLTVPPSNDFSPGDNSFDVAHADYDGGAMDGFDQSGHQPGGSGGVNDRIFHADAVDGAYVSYG